MLSVAQWELWAMAVPVPSSGGAVVRVVRKAWSAGDRGNRRRCVSMGVTVLWVGAVVFAAWALSVAVSWRAEAQDVAVTQTPAAAARERANDEIERLRMEIRLLTELRDAQEALRDWNRLRVQAGEPGAVLDRELCGRLKEWCAALPGTFGASGAGEKLQ